MSTLKDKAVNGVLWTSIRTVITALTGPLLLFVQARYLTPSEFGVLAIINIFISIINVIENFGISTAVIQRDHISKNERSSLFLFQVAFCSFLGLILIVSAPLFSNIFNMPLLDSLLRLISVIIFLNGPMILFTAFLEKDFHFKALSIIQIIREIVLLVSTTLLFVFGFGLYGFVIGQIIAVFVMLLLILGVSIKKNLVHFYFHFKISDIKPFLKFGVYIAGKQLMTQLTHHVDELIIGYYFSANVLGLYFFAKNLLNRLRLLITTAFAKVLFPILSKVKNDRVRLTYVYNEISRYIGIIAFPIFFGVALTADIFIPIFFGEEWLGSINYFMILSIAYIPYILTANLATSLLYSVNKPKLVLKTDIIVNLIYIILLLLLSWANFGIYAIAILYAAYLVFKTMTLQFLTQLELLTSFKDYVGLFKNTIISTFAMIVLISASKVIGAQIFEVDHSVIVLILNVVLGCLAYAAVYYLLDKNTLTSMKQMIFKK